MPVRTRTDMGVAAEERDGKRRPRLERQGETFTLTEGPRGRARDERRAAPKPARAPLGGVDAVPGGRGVVISRDERRAAPKPARAPLGGVDAVPGGRGV